MSGRPSLRELTIEDDAAAWEALGFAVGDGALRAGDVVLRLTPGDGGIVGWELGAPEPGGPQAHRNGVVGVDHVVVRTTDPEATVARLEALGLECRGRREAGEIRQAFLPLANALVEVVGPLGDGPDSFWGVTFVTADLDGAAAALGDRLGDVRDAVQPGRRIATARGTRTRIALMTPRG